MANEKQLKISLDLVDHTRFKAVTASLNMSMKDATIEALKMWINSKCQRN